MSQDSVSVVLQFASGAWDSFWPNFIVQTIGSLAGALVGALAAMKFAIILQSMRDRKVLTQRFIEEFLGVNYLHHRIGAARIRRAISENRISIERVASGFWHPGCLNYYKGKVTEGLDEHQHLEALLGWVQRLSSAVQTKQVNAAELIPALRESYHWLDDLLTPLAMETSRQVEAAQKIGTQDVHSPGWVSAVDHLRMVFGLQKIDALPTKFRLQQLTTKHSAYS